MPGLFQALDELVGLSPKHLPLTQRVALQRIYTSSRLEPDFHNCRVARQTRCFASPEQYFRVDGRHERWQVIES